MSDSYKTKEAFLKGSFEHDVSVFDSFGRGRASCAQDGKWAVAEGYATSALGIASHSDGISSEATTGYSFTWNGKSDERYATVIGYNEGSYCINPKDKSGDGEPLKGFYIGENNLQDIIDSRQFNKDDLLTSDNYWSGENTFSDGTSVLFSPQYEVITRQGTYFRNGLTLSVSGSPGSVPTVDFTNANYFLVPTFQRANATVTTENAANLGYVYSALSLDIVNPSRSSSAMIAKLTLDVDKTPNRIATCKYVESQFPIATKNRYGYVSGVTKMYNDIYQLFDDNYYRKDPETYTISDSQNPNAWQHLDGCATQSSISIALCGQHIDTSYNPQLWGTCLADRSVLCADGMPCAWYTVSGKMKLYQTSGYNVDGTMSQYAIVTSFGIPFANDTEYGKLKLSDSELSYDTFTQTYAQSSVYSHFTGMTQRAISHSVHVPNSTTDSSLHEPLSSVKGVMFLHGEKKDGLDAYEGCVNADVIYDLWQYHGATPTSIGVAKKFDELTEREDVDEKGIFSQKFITDNYYPVAVVDSGKTGLVTISNDDVYTEASKNSVMPKSKILQFFTTKVWKQAGVNDSSYGAIKLYGSIPSDVQKASNDGGVSISKIGEIEEKLVRYEMLYITSNISTRYFKDDKGKLGDEYYGEYVCDGKYVDGKAELSCGSETLIVYNDGFNEEFGQFYSVKASSNWRKIWIMLQGNYDKVSSVTVTKMGRKDDASTYMFDEIKYLSKAGCCGYNVSAYCLPLCVPYNGGYMYHVRGFSN